MNMNNDFEDLDNNDVSNDYVNQLTLNFLISKSQLQKLKKIQEKETNTNINTNINAKYDKHRISDLFNKLINNNRPDDLLEDVKTCFDAFIEKSIYYLEIHDKNVCIQNEREYVGDHFENLQEDDVGDYVGYNEYNEVVEDDEEYNEVIDDEYNEDEEQYKEDLIEDYFEEPVINVNKKSSQYNKGKLSKGVDDIQKLPLDWFNATRQNYKINQIIPRKKEIIIDNLNTNTNTNTNTNKYETKNNSSYQKKKI